MRDGKKCAAIVLAAGSGKRMGTKVPKQFLELDGKPILYYCLKTFEDSFIDEIVIVCRPEDEEYVRTEIACKYSFEKITRITAGGKERYHSVAAGLEAIEECDYVFIHDGARPFVNDDILDASFRGVSEYHSAITSVPAKDTVKIADENRFVCETPKRDRVYLMQTPQTFDFDEIRQCYRMLINNEEELISKGIAITDDAMVMEYFGDRRVYLSQGDYKNIKVTTPEDIAIAKMFLE